MVAGLLQAAVFAIAAMAASLAPLRAEPEILRFQFTPAEALQVAQRALSRGKFELASQIAQQILAADPDHSGAKLVLLAALARGGQPQAAVEQGKRLYRRESQPKLRFQAAVLTAQALSEQDKIIPAKWWLRRATGSVSEPQDQALLQRSFASLDARQPLRLDLSFSGGPSSNVNGGSSLHDSIVFWGGLIEIPIAALPGSTAATQARLSYRISSSERLMLTGFGKWTNQQVWLSTQSKIDAPQVKGSDFSSQGLDFGLEGKWLLKPDLMLHFIGQSGYRQFGSGKQSKTEVLDLNLRKSLKSKAVLGLGLTVTAAQDTLRPQTNTLRYAVKGTYSQPLKGGSFSAYIGTSVTQSEAIGAAFRAGTLGASYQRPEALRGVNLQAFGEVELRDYWKLSNEHLDLRAQLGVSGEMPRFSVLGYVPKLTLTATRSVSDVVIRDTADFAVTFGLNSAF